MLVKDYMTRHPLMAEPAMSIVEAQHFMADNKIRHLPIVGDGKRLLGLVTRQSLLVDPGRLGSLDMWEIARYLSGLSVTDVMVRQEDVVTINPDATIESAARLMGERRIGCLPVVENGILVGIITELDLLRQLTELFSMRVPGVRVTLRMPQVRGEMAKLVSAIAAKGWGIMAFGGVDVPKDPTKWEAVLKVRDVSPEEVVEVVRSVGHEVVDVRQV